MHQMLTDSAIWVALLGFVFYFIRKLWENSSVNKAILAEAERLLSVAKQHKEFWQNVSPITRPAITPSFRFPTSSTTNR